MDGNRNAYFGNNSCSETDFGLSSWSVDLGTEIYVTSVTITTRADAYWREKNRFSITVMTGGEETSCASGFFKHDGGSSTYACEVVKKGTNVKIQQSQVYTKLSLCEVEVHGHPPNFYENEGKTCVGFCFRLMEGRVKHEMHDIFIKHKHMLQFNSA